MTTFPAVAFHAAPSAGGVVIVFLSHSVIVDRFGAVVGIKEDERVFVDSEFVELVEQSADEYVQLKDEIASGAAGCFASEFLRGDHGGVGDLC